MAIEKTTYGLDDLLQADNAKRLKELQGQVEVYRRFADPPDVKLFDLAKKIGLSQEQVDSLREAFKGKFPVPPAPVQVTEEKVAMMRVPPVNCPECGQDYSTILMADGLRLKFNHGIRDICSRSNTFFYRPKAQFTEFV